MTSFKLICVLFFCVPALACKRTNVSFQIAKVDTVLAHVNKILITKDKFNYSIDSIWFKNSSVFISIVNSRKCRTYKYTLVGKPTCEIVIKKYEDIGSCK